MITLDAPAFAREAGFGVTIGYEDTLAYPSGVAFVGVDSEQLAVLPDCAPANAAARVTTFACTVTLPATDGAHSVCAVVPDAAVPDNPNSSDQRGTATQANLSERKCREVVLDRAAPSATVTVPPDLRAGNAALFVAEAGDATSGIASATWNWGDGTTSTGFDASHVYAAPGTYRLRFAVTDAAGHRTEVTKDLTVQGVSMQPTPTPSPTPTPVATSTPGLGDTAYPEVTSTPTPALAVRVTRASGKVVRLTVTGATGSARVVLKRGKRVIVSKRLTIKAGQVTLNLPRKLAPGKHVIELTAGGRTASAPVNGARAKAAAAPRIDPAGLRPKLP